MATTNFVNGSTLTDAGWFNDVDALVYEGTFPTGLTNLNPDANDGAALGTSGTAWSDLFLANGAVINFFASDYTITHTADLLTFNGAVSMGSASVTAGKVLTVASPLADYACLFQSTHGTTPFGMQINFPNAAPNGTGNQFWLCNDSGATRAELRSNGGLANFSANNVDLASDINLKRNVVDAPDYTSAVEQIKFRNWIYRDDADETLNDGIVTQELQTIFPDLVEEMPDGMQGYRITAYQQRINSVIPRLIKRIKALETR